MNNLVENFKGVICFLILLTNTLVLATLMIPLGIIKFLIPIKSDKKFGKNFIRKIGVNLFKRQFQARIPCFYE